MSLLNRRQGLFVRELNQRGIVADRCVLVMYVSTPKFSPGHMTLAIAICAEEAIVLVSDGRMSRPELDSLALVKDDARKLHAFGRFGIATAGFTGLTDEIVAEMRKEGTLESCVDLYAAQEAVKSFIQRYMKCFDGLDHRPFGSLLVAGYYEDGKPGAHVLHTRAGYQPGRPPYWVGSGMGGVAADYLSMLLLGGWEGRPPLEQAKVFGVTAISVANGADLAVGMPVSLATIHPKWGFEDLSDEIPEYVARSEAAVQRLREAFRR